MSEASVVAQMSSAEVPQTAWKERDFSIGSEGSPTVVQEMPFQWKAAAIRD